MPSIPAPLKIRDYRAFWVARFFATVAGMMMVVVIGWQVYDIARESMSRDDAAFLLGMIGLGVSMWPHVVPPSVTIWQAAAPLRSQEFMLVGVLLIMPLILAYTGWTYWVFRGKVGEHGYH